MSPQFYCYAYRYTFAGHVIRLDYNFSGFLAVAKQFSFQALISFLTEAL